MARYIYEFSYDFYAASCKIEVDTEKFTEKMANDTLTFFSWNYDKEANPIDEVMKKYAMMIIQEATTGSFLSDLQNKEIEGFYKLNGENGIKLLEVEEFEFDEEDLTFKKIQL